MSPEEARTSRPPPAWAEEVRRLDAETTRSAETAFHRGERAGARVFLARPLLEAARGLVRERPRLRAALLRGYAGLVHAAKLWDLERRWREQTIVAFRDGSMEILCRREWRPAVSAWLRNEIAGEPRAGGRGGIERLTTDDGPVIVRELRRGGAMRALGRHYLGRRSRAEREFLLLLLARRVGLPVPEPVAAVTERTVPWLYRARLLTGEIPEARTLWDTARESRRSELWRLVGRELCRIHEAGLHHRDLNLGNVLVLPGEPPRIALVDLDRASFSPRAVAAPRRMLALRRLRRSARKLDPEGQLILDEDLDALERAYRETVPRR